MSRARVHNLSISLDGFGTGEGLTFEAPFGHAGERLHEWMFATRFWGSMAGDGGGSTGVEDRYDIEVVPSPSGVTHLTLTSVCMNRPLRAVHVHTGGPRSRPPIGCGRAGG